MAVKVRVWAELPGSPTMPFYRGYVDVFVHHVEDAEEQAKAKIRETHGNRNIQIKKIEVL